MHITSVIASVQNKDKHIKANARIMQVIRQAEHFSVTKASEQYNKQLHKQSEDI